MMRSKVSFDTPELKNPVTGQIHPFASGSPFLFPLSWDLLSISNCIFKINYNLE